MFDKIEKFVERNIICVSAVSGAIVGIVGACMFMECQQKKIFDGCGIKEIKHCTIDVDTVKEHSSSNWYEIVWWDTNK